MAWTAGAALLATSLAAATLDGPPPDPELRAIVEGMKTNPRGPFRRIRWFCSDGTVLPPKPYACRPHGGGIQHGEWSDEARRLRDAGFPVANVLAELGPEDFGPTEEGQTHLRILLLERFLTASDDGWIFRRARFYRGALQTEDELAGAKRIVTGLAADPAWLGPNFPLLYETARLLPWRVSATSLAEVRGLATSIHERDPGFEALRNKIHGSPQPADAGAVREYARTRGDPALADDYERLAAGIDEVARRPDPVPGLESALGALPSGRTMLADATARLASAGDAAARLAALGDVMVALRSALADVQPEQRVPLLGLLLDLELEAFRAARSLEAESAGNARRDDVRQLAKLAAVLHGMGLLTARELEGVREAAAALDRPELSLDEYRSGLGYLGRVPAWSGRRLAFFFEEPIARLAVIEPEAHEFIPDRLRGTVLSFYSRVLDRLSTDAAVASGVRHELLGEPVSVGLQALNPGLATGTLHTPASLAQAGTDPADAILMVPETLAELPAVAGILTENAGNELSHVQLLARNLGIPNVVIGPELLPRLTPHLGRRVRVAASPGGVVQLNFAGNDGGAAETLDRPRIQVDLDTLDLDTVTVLRVDDLSEADSGVRVGPKAARLGDLEARYGDAVAPALAIPFGAFRRHLQQPLEPGGPAVFDWMKATYTELAGIADDRLRRERTAAFLDRLRTWITSTPMTPDLEAGLRRAMVEQFGPDGAFGVFVRSDTNVEDLEGFTGAGLNLTVPNIVGIDATVESIRDVWASPFTERAFGWRQALMDQPEHVYAAVLLHKSVNSDKSGVLITADAATGDPGFLSIVVNEGVGGGVEGQSAESLRVRLADGRVQLLGSATAPRQRVLLPAGGSALVPASGADAVLTPTEIERLVAFARGVPRWFGSTPGAPPPVADVEFGFLGGKLVLFQIRPLVDSDDAQTNATLIAMDASLAATASVVVDMNDPPTNPET